MHHLREQFCGYSLREANSVLQYGVSSMLVDPKPVAELPVKITG